MPLSCFNHWLTFCALRHWTSKSNSECLSSVKLICRINLKKYLSRYYFWVPETENCRRPKKASYPIPSFYRQKWQLIFSVSMLGSLFHTTCNSQDILGGIDSHGILQVRKLAPHYYPLYLYTFSIVKEYFQFSYKHMSVFYYSLAHTGKSL